MLKLKLQYFGHLIWRAKLLEKTLMLGKMEGRRRRGQQRMRWLDGITDSMDMIWANSGRWWRTGKPSVLYSMGLQRVAYDLVTEQQLSDRDHKITMLTMFKDIKKRNPTSSQYRIMETNLFSCVNNQGLTNIIKTLESDYNGWWPLKRDNRRCIPHNCPSLLTWVFRSQQQSRVDSLSWDGKNCWG